MKDINVAPVKATISLEDLGKLDIRVGMIEKVIDIEGSDNLVAILKGSCQAFSPICAHLPSLAGLLCSMGVPRRLPPQFISFTPKL